VDLIERTLGCTFRETLDDGASASDVAAGTGQKA